MKNYLVLLAVASAFSLTSCGDDDDDVTSTPAPAPTKTELITNKNWKQTDQTRTANGATMNTFGGVPSCYKDNITKFTTDMKVNFDEGANLCPGEAQNIQGTWAFRNNESELRVIADGEELDYKLIELTATKMSVSLTENDTIFGTPVTITENYIFTAQ